MNPFLEGFLAELEKEGALSRAQKAMLTAGLMLPMVPMPSDVSEGAQLFDEAKATRRESKSYDKGSLMRENFRQKSKSQRAMGAVAMLPGPHQIGSKVNRLLMSAARKR